MPEGDPVSNRLTIDQGFFLGQNCEPADFVIEGTINPSGVTGPLCASKVECGSERTLVENPGVKPKVEVVSAKWDVLFSGLGQGDYVAEFMIQGDKTRETQPHWVYSFSVGPPPGPLVEVIPLVGGVIGGTIGLGPPTTPPPPPSRKSPLFDFAFDSATQNVNDYLLTGRGPPHTHPDCVAILVKLYRVTPAGNFTVVGESICRGLWHNWKFTWVLFEMWNPVYFTFSGGPTGDRTVSASF